MCEKKRYCSRVIDECIREEVKEINTYKDIRTLASCCGHGVYPKTIVVENTLIGVMYEWFSRTQLHNKYKNGKKRKRFYKRDPKGFYYISELMVARNKKRVERLNSIGSIPVHGILGKEEVRRK